MNDWEQLKQALFCRGRHAVEHLNLLSLHPMHVFSLGD